MPLQLIVACFHLLSEDTERDESKDSVKKLADAIVEAGAEKREKTARDKPLGLHAWVVAFQVSFRIFGACKVCAVGFSHRFTCSPRSVPSTSTCGS